MAKKGIPTSPHKIVPALTGEINTIPRIGRGCSTPQANSITILPFPYPPTAESGTVQPLNGLKGTTRSLSTCRNQPSHRKN